MNTSFERAKCTTDEWYTPKEIIDSLGEFDLDPCAPEKPLWPTATVMWNKHDDGLSRDWDVPHCSAPSLWQAQKWLREVKRIEVNASWESIKRYWFFYTNLMDVPDIVNLEDISDSVYSTYEQALSAGIAAALELIEKK